VFFVIFFFVRFVLKFSFNHQTHLTFPIALYLQPMKYYFLFLMLTALNLKAQTKPDIQGHRGCRGLTPENTIPAMIKALQLGVTTLEMDAVITADKQVILSHEPFFSHEISLKPDGSPIAEAEEKQLNIYKMSYAETQKFDVGLKPHPRFRNQEKLKVHKPKLSDVIDSVEAYVISNHLLLPFYNIETKSAPEGDNIFHPEPAEFVNLLMNVLISKKITDRVIIQSFDTRTLKIIHAEYPSVRTALLVEGNGEFAKQVKQLGFKPSIYSPDYKLVNKKMIRYCHSKGIKLIPWTVNTEKEINDLISAGVDGIITDYPNLVKK
jgi:glycerophosphoryl diester phosphodiesterase